MGVRPIITLPDPRLRVSCTPVADFDGHLAALVPDMFDTMYAASGQGLAAPQLGLTIRLIVTDTGWPHGKSAPLAMVNPVIHTASVQREICAETCLSIPGAVRRIARPSDIRVTWDTPEGAPQEGRFLGLRAVAIQHEIDHLDGILMIDHPDTPEPAKSRL
jgi:peptide deformylase